MKHFRQSIVSMAVAVVGPRAFDTFHSVWNLRTIPRIRKPTTYSERILHRKFYCPFPNSALYSDKLRVRDYVADRVGDHVLNELYCAAQSPDEIDFASLPSSFAIKMNNGSSRNILVYDKTMADKSAIKRQLAAWLSQPFGFAEHETYYLEIEPHILVERLLSQDQRQSSPDDFKFQMFHGRCAYIRHVSGRGGSDKTVTCYTADWRPLPDSFLAYHEHRGKPIPAPPFLPEMLRVAETLSRDFDYVRVDLYNVNDGVIFSELTLTPNGGLMRYRKALEYYLGMMWEAGGMRCRCGI
jgi:hypothetical protein